MARPQRCRRICRKPVFDSFYPCGDAGGESVELTIDEYEVLRLVDYEKKTHSQCAEQMDISRSTVTEIYENARFKLADSIVNGKCLRIMGGNYRLCDGSAAGCCGKPCLRAKKERTDQIIEKGDIKMRIAVTYENGQIFQHFGHTEQFKIYDIEGGDIVSSRVVDTNGQGHGALAGVLAANDIDALICGGIGGGAQMALAQAGIRLYGGVSGNADDAVSALLKGDLGYDPDVHCDHHDHEHGEGGHSCGEHGCGSRGCGEHSCH